jgi:hypothetical protein
VKLLPSLLSLGSIALLTAAIASARAAQPSDDSPSLNDLLIRMQSNLSGYLSSVPNFFCDEHVESSLSQRGAARKETMPESIFRMRRSKNPAGQNVFLESREIRTIDKKAAQGEEIHGPAVFSGAFTNAVSIVSLELSHCYSYHLEPHEHLGKTPAIVVAFTSLDSALTDKTCISPEHESGRAWIDPTDFHLMRVEDRIPNHEAVNGILTQWTWEIEYAPVAFDAKTFWMPKTISTRAVANDDRAEWGFKARYGNYHKMTVTSHILTDSGESPP